MDKKDEAEVLVRLLDGQLGKFQQTREIEFKVNLALWTAIVIGGGFLYQHGLRLDTYGERVLYGYLGAAIYPAHTFLWMVPIQYSEDADAHYILQYRKAIESACGFTSVHPDLTPFWRRYRKWRKTSWTWVLAETWMTAVLLVVLGVVLALGPRASAARLPPNKPLRPAAAGVTAEPPRLSKVVSVHEER